MDPIHFVQEYLDALSGGDFDRIAEFLCPDFRFYDNGELWAAGTEGVMDRAQVVRRAFPDARQRITTSHVSEGGSAVTAQFVFEGLHVGSFMGVAPSGRRVSIRGVAHARLRHGKLAEAHMWWNLSDIADQIGI